MVVVLSSLFVCKNFFFLCPQDLCLSHQHCYYKTTVSGERDEEEVKEEEGGRRRKGERMGGREEERIGMEEERIGMEEERMGGGKRKGLSHLLTQLPHTTI